MEIRKTARMKVEVRRLEYAHPTGLLFAGYPPVRFPAEATGEQRGNAAAGLGALTQYAATWRASPSVRLIGVPAQLARAARSGDADFEARYSMLVSLGATKLMADRLMQDLRSTGPRQAIVDFAGDGEGDIRSVTRSSTSSGRGVASEAT